MLYFNWYYFIGFDPDFPSFDLICSHLRHFWLGQNLRSACELCVGSGAESTTRFVCSSQEHRDRATERTSAESTDLIQYCSSEIGTDSSVLEHAGCCVTIPTEFVNTRSVRRSAPMIEVSTNSVSHRTYVGTRTGSIVCAEAGVRPGSEYKLLLFVLQYRSWRRKGKGTDALLGTMRTGEVKVL